MHDPSTVIQADGKFYVYATGNGLPALVSDDGWTWRRTGSLMQAVPGGARARGHCARRQQHLGAGSSFGRRQVLPLLLRAGHAAEGCDRSARRARRSIRRRQTTSGRTPDRSSGPTASKTATRSIPACSAIRRRDAVAHLRLVLRLHPPRRAGSEDREAPASRRRSRSTSRSTPKRR